MRANKKICCPKHPRTVMRLVCPACKGAKGGKATARKYTREQLAAWGRSGGRPKKAPSSPSAAVIVAVGLPDKPPTGKTKL
jgi:hypothetical protein